jgi:outer membrane protein assembly factor BamA
MLLNRSLSFLLLVALSATLHAQSYSPKVIRFEGAKAYAPADLLATAGLKQGATISVKEIEAAMQRLADTGLFSDTRYAVNPQALTLTLTPIDAKQSLPVRYANFVWWGPDELTPLVHARVPLFNGAVPLNGGLIDSVKQALVALLAEKGITGSVDSMSSSVGGATIALTVSSPEIKVGEIRLDGASAAGGAEVAKVRAKLSGEDFDEVSTRAALINETVQIYRDDGYLDIAIDPGQHSAPRADGPSRFLIDLTATIHGDELYHVASADVHAVAPVSSGDLQKLLQIKAGDVASVYELRTAESRLTGAYRTHGYLDADVHVDEVKDSAAHRIGYTLTPVPGDLYHVASVKTSGFTPDQQAEFERSFRVEPNAIFDSKFGMQIGMLNQQRAFAGTRIQPRMTQDRNQHTVVVTLVTVRAPAR